MNYIIVLCLAVAAGMAVYSAAATVGGVAQPQAGARDALHDALQGLAKRLGQKERRRGSQELTGAGAALAGAVSNLVPASERARKSQIDSLKRTGIHMSSSQFWALRVICVAAGLVIGSAVAGNMLAGDDRGLWALPLGAFGGWALPQMLLLAKRAQRREEIERQLPNALDLMAVSVSAGMTLERALATVASTTDGALAEGFADVAAQARFKGLDESLREFADDAGVQSLTIFAASIIQARQQGNPIAEILRLQAETVRETRRMKLEEQINKLPVKIIFPIMLLIFPALFGVVLVPAAMRMFSVMGAL